MRAALFTDTWDEVNGVSRTLHRWANFCAQGSIELDVYALATLGDPGVERDGSLTVRRLRPLWPLRYYEHLAWDLCPRPDLWAAFHARRYDLVHLATPGSLGWHGWLLARLTRRPLLGSYHTDFPAYGGIFTGGRLRRWPAAARWADTALQGGLTAMLRAFYGPCRTILAPSPKTVAQVQALVQRPVGYFRRGIDTQQFSPEFRQAGPRPVVLYVGRLSREKNVALLKRLVSPDGSWDLVVVGDGPLRAELEAALPTARFTGYLYGADLARAYASADVFAFPSRTDTLGNVVLEAQACGLPAVVLDREGPGSLLRDGLDGLIADDEGTFVAHVQSLLADDQRRRAMGAAARAGALSRDWPSIFRGLLDDYRRAAVQEEPHDALDPALSAHRPA